MRDEAIKKLLARAALKFREASIESMPFDVGDRGGGTGDSYSMAYDSMRPELKDFCGPDWTFVHWPDCGIESFDMTRDEMVAAGRHLPKFDKAAWFGNIHSPSKEVAEHLTRPMLKRMAEENPDIMEVRHVARAVRGTQGYMTMPEMAKEYRILIDIGGNGYSGRVKWLLFSRRTLLMVERRYLEYFSEDLLPWKHYVPVRQDLSDLKERIVWTLENPEKAGEIAHNALGFAMENFSDDKILARVKTVFDNVNNHRIRRTTGR